ncbi:MAG: transporter [Blastocatellia bacterium]|nr:transporter [Blastocatellia bacterium]
MSANPPQNGEGPRDLGFGSVVARESRQRLLNRDGSFNVRRNGLRFWESLSLYHSLLTMSWVRFNLVLVGSFLAINCIFGIFFMLCGRQGLLGLPTGGWVDWFSACFFFSVQTFGTIGYGVMSPVTKTANLVVTLESLVGLLWVAIATGLLFARFSRPSAKIMFSQKAIIAPYRGMTAFEFRIVNARSNQIIELEAKVLFSRLVDENGRQVRRFDALSLERQKVVFFPLSWTIVHPITETSPLFGLAGDDLRRSEAEFLILLTGIDETFLQTVHTRTSYKADEIVWNAKFSSIFNPHQADEPITINIDRLSEIEGAEEF